MSKDAVMWIRDGVLVDRMHVNPVVFAAAYWVFISEEKRSEISLEQLINFGFAKSGVSCLDKMNMFNDEVCDLLSETKLAADYYNDLATRVAVGCTYFKGMPGLLRKLAGSGVANFITSAVEQKVLDDWAASKQAELLKGSLQEILGKRENFTKGVDHFRHVSETIDGGRIFYVADAVSEIKTANVLAEQFKITPIGFAHVITVERVMQAVCMVAPYMSNDPYFPVPFPAKQFRVDPDKLELPNEKELVSALAEAGAPYVVTGEAGEIVENLANQINEIGVLG